MEHILTAAHIARFREELEFYLEETVQPAG